MELIEIISESLNDGKRVISYKRADGGTADFVAIGVAAVIAMLAQFAADYMKGQKLEGLFASLKDEMANLIAAAVAELERYIAEKLDQQVIDDCQAKTNAAIQHLREWERAPTGADYRLDVADENAEYCIDRLEPFGLKALFPYVNSVSIKLLVLIVRYKAKKQDGELTNAYAVRDRCAPTIAMLANDLVLHWQNRINGVSQVVAWTTTVQNPCAENAGERIQHAKFSDNGIDRTFNGPDNGDPIRQAEAERNAVITAYSAAKQAAIDNVLIPISNAVKSWDNLLTHKDTLGLVRCP